MNTTFISTSKHTRVSPRKARLVVKAVKTTDPEKAMIALSFMPQKSSGLIASVIKTALADAKNQSARLEDLVIKSIIIEEGVKFKRFRARSKGMAHPYIKRTSHIKVTLEQKPPIVVEKAVKTKAVEAKPELDTKLAQSVKSEKTVKAKTIKKS